MTPAEKVVFAPQERTPTSKALSVLDRLDDVALALEERFGGDDAEVIFVRRLPREGGTVTVELGGWRVTISAGGITVISFGVELEAVVSKLEKLVNLAVKS